MGANIVKPLYEQILESLTTDIRNGKYPPGSKLPTEAQLSKQFFVSRITSKRALDELAANGLAVRHRRTGTFVRYPAQCSPDAPTPSAIQLDSVSTTVDDERPHIIVAIMPFNSNSYDAVSYLRGITSVLDRNACYTIIQNSEASYRTEAKIFERCLKDRIDGIIFYPYDSIHNYGIIKQLAVQNYPLVMIDKAYSGIDCPSVVFENRTGTKAIVNYLIQMGHRRIAFFANCNIAEMSSIKERYDGYIEAITESGLPLTMDYTVEIKKKTIMNDSAEVEKMLLTYGQAAQELMEKGVTAVQCCTDGVAYLLAQGCSMLGIRIPDDLSVTGFDNLPTTNNLHLTTVKQDLYLAGIKSAELMLEQLHHHPIANLQIRLPVELVMGSSVLKNPEHPSLCGGSAKSDKGKEETYAKDSR